ncbi:MAG: haloacid dehalogenase-like hydrolase [Alphaproteobacteria bacterium]|nr:haloacid dehalogenase-like hydrolase [Alphaproteobacteria bacterium]
MMRRLIPMAICYDFDGTLVPGNMQEYGFIKKLNMTPSEFWNTANGLAKKQEGDEILTYMKTTIDESRKRNLPITREDFRSYGKDITFFEGVETYFKRINKYAKSKGVKLQHFIISSGLKEMLEGTAIAHEFTEIFASTFLYDDTGAAVWPAMVLNYTSKTQYIYRINKGCLDVTDIEGVNRHVSKECKPVPLTNILYIGDGNTDIPCMAMLNKAGGHTLAVYKEGQKERAMSLNRDGRAHMVALADYREGKKIDQYVKAVIDKIAADGNLQHVISTK